MWTGIAALRNIDQTLQTIRNDVVRLDNQLSQLTGSIATNQRRRLKIINDIAAVRLAEIEKGELQENLTAADQQAAQILQQREVALDAVNTDIEALNQKIVDAELEREQQLNKVNEISQQIDDAEAKVQEQLKIDKDYIAQLEKARTANSVAQEASHKAQQSQADMAKKSEPFEQDPLFMYLWQRQYGTTDYKGRLFSRFMDGWVAKLIKYEPARVNFWNLTEIPKRLQEHADSVTEIADTEHQSLQQLELMALQNAGVKALEEQLVILRLELDERDDVLEQLEGTLNEKLEQRAQFVAGQDEYIHRCIARLTQALDHQNLRSIHRYVLATNSPTDDKLVIELQSVDDKLADVGDDLQDARLIYDKKLDKLKQLEQVRRNFKNSRFDDVRSGFGNESLLANVLGQFLQGVVSGSDVWRVIKRNQRYRNAGSIPDFGSGGLGDLLGAGRRSRSARKPSWHRPAPRRGGGGFNLPRRPSSGGFRTGGSF